MSYAHSVDEQRVVNLLRYPVKSMMGEELNAAELDDIGVIGDRAYALVDVESGRIVSAKNPQKWPDIFSYRATYREPVSSRNLVPPVWIHLPNGANLRSDDPGAASVISQSLGRVIAIRSSAPENAELEQYWPERAAQRQVPESEPLVTQERIALDAPARTFYDYSVVHLLTTATLNALQQLHAAGRIEVRRFRPNIVVGTSDMVSGFVENEWVGRTVSIGEARLHVSDPCPRCVMPTLAQGDLPRDPLLTRAIAHNSVQVSFAGRPLPSVGVYARVVRGGRVRRGDTVSVH